MPRLKKQHIKGINYIADRVIVHFRQEFDFNVKQAAVDFGTDFEIPGNYLSSDTVPTLSVYTTSYLHARVLKSTIRATFTNVEATYSKDVGVTQLPLNATANTTPSATVYLSEQPRTKSAYLTPLSGSRSLKTITMSGSTTTAFGDRTTSTAQSDLIPTGDLSSPPAEPWSWSVWTQNIINAGAAEAAGTNVRCMVTYTIEFLQRVIVDS